MSEFNVDRVDLSRLRRELQDRGLAMFQYDDGPVHSFPYDAPWMTDTDFVRLYESVRSHTLVDRTRCFALYSLLPQLTSVPGDLLEVGSWRGGTAGLIASRVPDRTLYVADTFVGVVKSSSWEHYQDGAHSDTSAAMVQDFLEQTLSLSNVLILEGIFPDETGDAIRDRPLSFVHIDVDVYESARDVFAFAWQRLSPRGVIVFDDYGFRTACSGVTRLVDEMRGDADKIVLENLNGQAYVIKTADRQAALAGEF